MSNAKQNHLEAHVAMIAESGWQPGSGEGESCAAPVAQQSEAGAQDAARYRFLREHWVSFSAAPPLSNLHWKGEKLDAKVDAAILAGGAHG